MEFDFPAVIEGIKDIKAIYSMNERINPIQDAENLESDLFVGTATIRGIMRRERLFGIKPNDTDSLEDRRYRLLVEENNQIPYTMRTLRKKLSILCGEDGYQLLCEKDRLTIRVELSRKNMFDDVYRMLENIVPLNISLCVGLLYNQYKTLSGFTCGELERYTYAQAKEEVIT